MAHSMDTNSMDHADTHVDSPKVVSPNWQMRNMDAHAAENMNTGTSADSKADYTVTLPVGNKRDQNEASQDKPEADTLFKPWNWAGNKRDQNEAAQAENEADWFFKAWQWV